MRNATAVSVVVLLLLAGCSGADTQAGTESVEGNDTARESVPLDEVDFPPGTSESGVDDPAALMDGHRTAVSTADYEVRAYHSYMHRYSGGDRKRFQEWVRVRSDRDARRAKTNLTRQGLVGGGKNATHTVLTEDGVSYQRTNRYYSRHYRTKRDLPAFGSIHNSTMTLNSSLNRTLTEGALEAVEAFSDGDDRFVRFRIRFPGRDAPEGAAVVRADGLITRIEAPDGESERYGGDEWNTVNDGVDRYRLQLRDDVDVRDVSWKDEAREGVRERLREGPTVDVSVGGCDNDGDRSYDEDDDLDNDGICDEG